MRADGKVFLWLGGDEAEKDRLMPLVQQAINDREKELGRPMNSQEILKTWGEVIEPDASKVTHIHAGPPKGMPPLR